MGRVWASRLITERGGDVDYAGQSQHLDDQVAQSCDPHPVVAGADLGSDFIEGDVLDPVEPVLHGPVPGSQVANYAGSAWVGLREGGDRSDGLGAPTAAADLAGAGLDPSASTLAGETFSNRAADEAWPAAGDDQDRLGARGRVGVGGQHSDVVAVDGGLHSRLGGVAGA